VFLDVAEPLGFIPLERHEGKCTDIRHDKQSWP
jgi:hypothetical protein